MASRVSTMVRRIGVEDPVVLGGGAALNVGFVKSLSRRLGGVEIYVLADAEYLGAHGAALIAWEAAQAEDWAPRGCAATATATRLSAACS